MYLYFANYAEGVGAPSFDKFARSIGVTCSELNSFRTHKKFDEAYLECSEIRRDYLIDNALIKRFDSSLVKYLIEMENGTEGSKDGELELKLEVVS